MTVKRLYLIAGILITLAVLGLLTWPLPDDCGSVIFSDNRVYPCEDHVNDARFRFGFIGFVGIVLALYARFGQDPYEENHDDHVES